ncbi:MAG: hypothetical protein KGV50_01820 [Gammaproteobacteria bacterium]|nr:hypothetical protein [Gammaproteobacteria bacterium]
MCETQDNTLKVGFINLGCQNSVLECQKIINSLFNKGYEIHDSYNNVSVVVIYCCDSVDKHLEEISTIKEEISEAGHIIITSNNDCNKTSIVNLVNTVFIHSENQNEITSYIEQFLSLNGETDNKIEINCDNNEEEIRLTPPHYAYLSLTSTVFHLCPLQIHNSKITNHNYIYDIETIYLNAKKFVKSGAQELMLVGKIDKISHDNYLAKICTKLTKFNIWLRLHDVFPLRMINNVIPLMKNGHVLPSITIDLQADTDFNEIIERISSWRTIVPELSVNVRIILDNKHDDYCVLNIIECLKNIRAYDYIINLKKHTHAEHTKTKILDKINLISSIQNNIINEYGNNRVGAIEPVMIDDTVEYEGVNNIALAHSVYDSIGTGGVIQVEDIYGAEPGQIVHVEIIEKIDKNYIAVPG